MTDAAKQCPTPKTPTGGANCYRDERGSGGADLLEVTENWPTPTARVRSGDASQETLDKNSRPLDEVSTHWPTPRNNTGIAGGNKTPDLAKKRLEDLATTWPSSPQPETTTPHGNGLRNWTRAECPRLNPGFQWWLMGWVTLTILCSDSAEMEWSHWWQQSLSIFCFLRLGE